MSTTEDDGFAELLDWSAWRAARRHFARRWTSSVLVPFFLSLVGALIAGHQAKLGLDWVIGLIAATWVATMAVALAVGALVDLRRQRNKLRGALGPLVRPKALPVLVELATPAFVANDPGQREWLRLVVRNVSLGKLNLRAQVIAMSTAFGPEPPWVVPWRHGGRDWHELGPGDEEMLLFAKADLSDIANMNAGANWHPGRFWVGVMRDATTEEEHPAYLPTPGGLASVYDNPAEFVVRVSGDNGLKTEATVKAWFANGPAPSLRAELHPSR